MLLSLESVTISTKFLVLSQLSCKKNGLKRKRFQSKRMLPLNLNLMLHLQVINQLINNSKKHNRSSRSERKTRRQLLLYTLTHHHMHFHLQSKLNSFKRRLNGSRRMKPFLNSKLLRMNSSHLYTI